MKKIKRIRKVVIGFVGALCSVSVQASSFLTITPNTTQLTLYPGSQAVVEYTVVNNTNYVLRNMSIASLNTSAQNVSISSNTCTSLVAGGRCQFRITIPTTNQLPVFRIEPKVCASNGAICAKTAADADLYVSISPVEHAYVGLANTVLSLTLAPETAGTVTASIAGFALSEPSGIAVNQAGSMVYVTDSGNAVLRVINTASNTIVASIPVGDVPAAVAVGPNDEYVYTVSYNNGQYNGTLTKVNAITNQVVGTPITVGNGPWSLSVSPDGSTAYVANSYDKTISVINLASGTNVVSPIPVNPEVGTPFSVVTHPNGLYVYVSIIDQNVIDVISTVTHSVVGTIAVGNAPKGLAISEDGATLYVALARDGTISKIDTESQTITQTSPFIAPGLVGVALSRDGSQIYATSDAAAAVASGNISLDAFTLIDTGGVQLTLGNFIG